MPTTCEHLAPLEAELERRGVRIGEPMPSPYGPEWGFWSEVDCTFDAASLRTHHPAARLSRQDPVILGSSAFAFSSVQPAVAFS